MKRIDEEANPTNNTRIIVGLVFLTLGAFLFADRLDVLPFQWNDYIFTWQSLLIGIGLISITKRESRTIGLILIFIGGVFLLAKILGLPLSFRYYFWPTLFLALGLIIIFQRKTFLPHFGLRKGVSTNDFIDDVSIFGGSEQKIVSRNFQGGRVTNIFGGSTFDMIDAELAPGVQSLDMFCLFGGSKIIVPTHWRMKIEIVSIFGGYNDKRRKASVVENDQNESLLVLKGVVIFGGGEIKSY